LKLLGDGPQKQALIDRMVAISQQDAPVSFGFFPYSSGAAQSWVHNYQPAVLIRDQGKYLRLDVDQRVKKLAEWNRPIWWPMWLGGAVLLAGVWALWRSLRRRERSNARGEVIA
jgi:hypothetical protein